MKKDKNVIEVPLVISEAPPEIDDLIDSNQKTAKQAIKILVSKDPSIYKDLSPFEKKNLITVFATNDKIVYGKAFDIVKVENGVSIDFSKHEKYYYLRD